MDFLAGGKGSSAASEGLRRYGKELPPSLLIGGSSLHVFPQHLTHQTGHARFLLGRFDPNPKRDLFLQGDDDFSHLTTLEGHEVRVNCRQGWQVGFLDRATPHACTFVPSCIHGQATDDSWRT